MDQRNEVMIQEGSFKKGGLKPSSNTPRPNWNSEPLKQKFAVLPMGDRTMSELTEAAKGLLKEIGLSSVIDDESHVSTVDISYVLLRDIEKAQNRLAQAIDSFECSVAHVLLDDIVETIGRARATETTPPLTISPDAYPAMLEAIKAWKEKQEDGHTQE